VAGLAAIFGSGAMTNSIREIEGMEIIFIIGSNTKETHPVIANRMIKAYRKGARIIVADPRTVPMVKFAEVFLKLRPGTDIALLNGMAHVIVKEGLQNDEFIREKTEGFDGWKKSVEEFTPANAEQITGVPKDAIIKAAKMYGGSRKAGIFYTMGITQHTCGTDNVRTIANLATLTGNIGREFTGVNPLRGQNNVQGASDAACLPNVYPGYQKVDLPEARRKFEQAWGVSLSPKPGLTATEMMNAAADGRLKALYIMGENPVLTDPHQHHTIKGLKNLEFLVVQDIFLTETAKYAHVVLPAACSFEKEGTFSNTERRVQRVRRAVTPPGEARDDLSIIMQLSRAMGYPMDYRSPEQVLEEFGKVWPALAGITYDRIKSRGIAWPCPTKDHPGTEFLYKDGFAKKIPFVPIAFNPPAETVCGNYPFVLTTGRNLFQYHSGSMSRRVAAIEKHAGEAYVEMNPADGKKLGIENGDMVRVRSRRGDVEIKARFTRRISAGTVFIPMHYREAAANVLTNDALDPDVLIPEFKVCAVEILPLKKKSGKEVAAGAK
jgi:formate dehydrogenase alpha subunit